MQHITKGQFLDNNMTCFFSKSENAVVNEMIRTETLFAHFLVEHNIALSASDHAGELFQNIFPDGMITKHYIVLNCLPFPNVMDQRLQRISTIF